MIKNQGAVPEGIEQKFNNKIKLLQSQQTDPFIVVNGNVQNIDYNDDIQREKAFYEFALNNLNKFQKGNQNIQFTRIDQEFLFKKIGEVVVNPIVKSAVHIKNVEEKELNQQGKKIQTLLTAKKSNQQKHEKIIEEIRKAMKKKPVDEIDKDEIQEIEQKSKPINNLKKNIKKKKTKRLGKLARLHKRLKQNSRKQK
ncbi:unnamed protein product (macronuclear) [Paramecium tetraurelia]|uniref:Uncharacterized protein n=1 Tax=Paramecium tetraurelia TaxID=5888 RepID=A0CH43_PARTE|nr:uncharacterized protein GSPATT00007550001 [Paramecium tetraurelia]CAK70110.1 unnamed protein product [Paramecium tetraurelia]|eukprot:XP_001437507.1 hypothetical protein (macronuclear) [Paramecium tetraurelia strain d4-2]